MATTRVHYEIVDSQTENCRASFERGEDLRSMGRYGRATHRERHEED